MQHKFARLKSMMKMVDPSSKLPKDPLAAAAAKTLPPVAPSLPAGGTPPEAVPGISPEQPQQQPDQSANAFLPHLKKMLELHAMKKGNF